MNDKYFLILGIYLRRIYFLIIEITKKHFDIVM